MDRIEAHFDTYHHYSTSYQSAYGKHWELFKPKSIQLHGSGYTSNIRPVIQYNSELDDVDNPKIKDFLKCNYLSTTHKDFSPVDRNQTINIFSTEKYRHSDPQCHSAFKNIYPGLNIWNSEGPVPQVTQSKGLKADARSKTDDDELCKRSRLMSQKLPSTTQSTKSSGDMSIKWGLKEETGSTRNHPMIDTLTGRPISPHMPREFRLQTNRPTGRTQYSDDFQVHETVTEKEARLRTALLKDGKGNGVISWNVCPPEHTHVDSESGLDRLKNLPEETLSKIMKTDPAEYQNLIHPSKWKSMYRGQYNGLPVAPPSKEARLGRTTTGRQESTGFTSNEAGHVDYDAGPPDRFVTDNMTRFYQPPPAQDKQDRSGHIHFNTLPSVPTTLAIGTGLSTFGPSNSMTEKAQTLSA
ncbi:unnamed protein product [Dicrocoelium dendriticum]|nr:unnamed protein product [Dicrocoelium dendriticum]